MSLQEFIDDNAARYAELRRDIHRHPEVGLEEVRTSDIVASLLESWGYQVTRGMAKTGVVGTLRAGDGGKVLGLRADMDALPMQENSGKGWQSSVTGKFHGCGHDGHTATLLFAAEWLAKTRNFNGTLHVIFQPGEELLYGGKLMLEDGLFAQFPCDAIFALHNMPGLPLGSFHFRKGAMLSSSDTLEITIKGVGGHGAIPEKAIDSVVVACYVVTALQTIVSRNVTPFQPAVVTVGSIQSGSVANIINDTATLKLSVRTLDPQVRNDVLTRIGEIAVSQAKSFGAKADVRHIHGSPALINDAEMTDFAIAVARELFDESLINTDASPVMASEDFAFMLEANPKGAYFFVGAGEGCSVHNPGYDFNDDIIKPAAAFWATLAERFLK
ncbi:M20 aminoacylase family protein [Mixta tenebrionis]|uniref:Amidohydrolase n=1 Tax=Mixta tenebrionis TaxID=2562439 RepID=A0A506VA68_9GAMM|nr:MULTISPECIES: M20 aminoacylase family protein [Mixta]QHM74504.1 putative hydrolase YxeP [Mixta theicola]TPW42458.1 amidohydrolase [Mixta tenebrionis]